MDSLDLFTREIFFYVQIKTDEGKGYADGLDLLIGVLSCIGIDNMLVNK